MISTGPLIEQEKLLATQLAGCRFLPGSSQKRFAKDIWNHQGNLTENQRWYLYFLIHRYRKQIGGIAQTVAGSWLKIHSRPESKKYQKKVKNKSGELQSPPLKNHDIIQLKLF